jgi:hypothetical protein
MGMKAVYLMRFKTSEEYVAEIMKAKAALQKTNSLLLKRDLEKYIKRLKRN